MTTMWAQGDLVKALQQARLARTDLRRARRPRPISQVAAARSLRPAPAR
jgi:hypothetical protein